MNQPSSTIAQMQAHRAVRRWLDARKCHYVEEVLHDHPQCHGDVIRYHESMPANETYSPIRLATHLITVSPAFAEAILAKDREVMRASLSPSRFVRRSDASAGLSL